jgi:hypothetical protein
MTNETIGIYDHSTGETIVREMTQIEQEQKNLESNQYLLSKQAVKIEKENQKALKIAAYTKLGLTEEEINALVPEDLEFFSL